MEAVPFYQSWQVKRCKAIACISCTFIATLLVAPQLYWGVLVAMSHFLYQRLHPRITEVGQHADGRLRDRHLRNLPALAADHRHVHGIVHGGRVSPDGQRWVACKPGFFLSVRVLPRLFRRRFLEAQEEAHRAGKLQFFGDSADLAEPNSFARWLASLRKIEWVVYAKCPFAGPEAVLAYLSRYTHRVAIANSRLVAMDERGITFRWKDCRDKSNPDRPQYKAMNLTADQFMRRFLLHVLPMGFHRIRHFDPIANNARKKQLALARQLLDVVVAPKSAEPAQDSPATEEQARPIFVCAHYGAQMLVVESFVRCETIRALPLVRGKS